MCVGSISPILSTILAALFLSHAHSQGLTLDDCNTDSDCEAPRECIDSHNSRLCDGSIFTLCWCVPPSLISCLSDESCPNGEVCAARVGSPFICISKSLVDNDSRFSRVTAPNPTGGGLTQDSCLRNSDCRAPRICALQLPSGLFGACVGSFRNCFCVPPVLTACESDSDCPPGEHCGSSGLDICASNGASSGRPTNFPNPTAIADPESVQDALRASPNVIVTTQTICIAERHMNGVKGIYESGRHARVLCDIEGSCATPGHFVVFHGKGMLMKRYCVLVGCMPNVMKVNSPAWERSLRMRSWSDGLEFTAFAARYETLAEELLLKGLVRAGL